MRCNHVDVDEPPLIERAALYTAADPQAGLPIGWDLAVMRMSIAFTKRFQRLDLKVDPLVTSFPTDESLSEASEAPWNYRTSVSEPNGDGLRIFSYQIDLHAQTSTTPLHKPNRLTSIRLSQAAGRERRYSTRDTRRQSESPGRAFSRNPFARLIYTPIQNTVAIEEWDLGDNGILANELFQVAEIQTAMSAVKQFHAMCCEVHKEQLDALVAKTKRTASASAPKALSEPRSRSNSKSASGHRHPISTIRPASERTTSPARIESVANDTLYGDNGPPPSNATISEPGRATTTRRSADDSFEASSTHDGRPVALSERRPTVGAKVAEKSQRSLSWRIPVQNNVVDQVPVCGPPPIAI